MGQDSCHTSPDEQMRGVIYVNYTLYRYPRALCVP